MLLAASSSSGGRAQAPSQAKVYDSKAGAEVVVAYPTVPTSALVASGAIAAAVGTWSTERGYRHAVAFTHQ